MVAKGTPFRSIKERALFIVDDFTNMDCRKVLLQLIYDHPSEACDTICRYWEKNVEGRK